MIWMLLEALFKAVEIIYAEHTSFKFVLERSQAQWQWIDEGERVTGIAYVDGYCMQCGYGWKILLSKRLN